jgi:integrase/recombinase XerD
MMMEDINRINNNNLPISTTSNNLVIPLAKKIDLIQQFLNNPAYITDIESFIDHNEREKQDLYEKFTDEMMMYTFIQKPSHIQEEYNKKEETKKEYIRDLLQFYGMLLSHETFLKENVTDFKEGSYLKNLNRRHIRRYQEWLHEVGYIKIPLHTAFLNNEVRMKDRPDRDLSYEEVKALLD